jgi:hypothetical protein
MVNNYININKIKERLNSDGQQLHQYQKNKCQINMSKVNSNNSIIGIFMKTYCFSGDPVFAQFHAFFLHFIFKSTFGRISRILRKK